MKLLINAHHKRRFWFVILLVICSGVAVFLSIKALRHNINLYFTPTQVIQGEAPMNVRIRMGGMVEKGSIVRGSNLNVQFTITDFTHKLTVQYSGIMPDLFREGQGVVVLGTLKSLTVFLADEVLAKHDENYMPVRENKS